MNEKPKLRPEPVDYTIAAIAPVFVIGMIGSLVYYLLAVLYRGEFPVRLMWILGLFTVAAVLIARIAIEQTRAYSIGYLLALSAATFVSAPGYLAGSSGSFLGGWIVLLVMIVLVAYLADRITFDCTSMNEQEESSGIGLLQSLGLFRAETDTQVPKPRSDEPQAKKKKHNPGVWVLYFSLLAIPLFGLGQLFVDNANRTFAFRMLVVYLFCSFSLLVMISLLTLRKYLRGRGISMETSFVVRWMFMGGAASATLLLILSLLPIPSQSIVQWKLPFQLTERDDLQAHKWGWGNEGVNDPDNKEANKAEKGQQPDQDEDDKSNGEKGNAPKNSDKQQGNQQGDQKGDKQGDQNGDKQSSKQGEQKGDSKSQDGKQNEANDKSDSEPQPKNQQSEPKENQRQNQPQDPSDPNKKNEPNENNQQKNNEPKNNQPDNQEQQAKPKPDNPRKAAKPERNQPDPSPSRSWSLQWNPSQFLNWIVLLVLVVIACVYGWKHRAMLQEFFAMWFSRRKKKTPAPIQNAVGPELIADPFPPFSSLANPFSSLGLSREQIILELFRSLQSWGYERRVVRNEEETPDEYVRRLAKKYPEQWDNFKLLGFLYSRIAYAKGKVSQSEIVPLKDLWNWLAASP